MLRLFYFFLPALFGFSAGAFSFALAPLLLLFAASSLFGFFFLSGILFSLSNSAFAQKMCFPDYHNEDNLSIFYHNLEFKKYDPASRLFPERNTNPDRNELTDQIVSKDYTKGYKCRI